MSLLKQLIRNLSISITVAVIAALMLWSVIMIWIIAWDLTSNMLAALIISFSCIGFIFGLIMTYLNDTNSKI